MSNEETVIRSFNSRIVRRRKKVLKKVITNYCLLNTDDVIKVKRIYFVEGFEITSAKFRIKKNCAKCYGVSMFLER